MFGRNVIVHEKYGTYKYTNIHDQFVSWNPSLNRRICPKLCRKKRKLSKRVEKKTTSEWSRELNKSISKMSANGREFGVVFAAPKKRYLSAATDSRLNRFRSVKISNNCAKCRLFDRFRCLLFFFHHFVANVIKTELSADQLWKFWE